LPVTRSRIDSGWAGLGGGEGAGAAAAVAAGVAGFAVADAALGAGGGLAAAVFGSDVVESAAGAGVVGVNGVVLLFLYEFTAAAGGAGFAAEGSGFFSASGFLAESVMLIERTWSFWTTANP